MINRYNVISYYNNENESVRMIACDQYIGTRRVPSQSHDLMMKKFHIIRDITQV